MVVEAVYSVYLVISHERVYSLRSDHAQHNSICPQDEPSTSICADCTYAASTPYMRPAMLSSCRTESHPRERAIDASAVESSALVPMPG
jgi:hypothetical protein